MATIPSEMTAVAGTVLTAAEWNSNVRDAVNFIITNRPIFEGRQTGAQSIGNSAAASIALDTEDIDNDNGHSTTVNPSRYTVQTAGRFQISGTVGYASNATGEREANIFVNGALVYSANIAAISGNSSRVNTRTFTKFFNVNDYIELSAWQTSGGALNTAISNTFEQPTLSIRWVATA